MSILATNRLLGRLMTYVTALVATVAVGTQAFAQSGRPVRLSFDLGTGIFAGEGAGARDSRVGPAIATAISGKLKSKGPHSLLLALNVSAFSNVDNADDCVLGKRGENNRDGACLPDYPGAVALAGMIGVERRFSNHTALRLLAGPSIYGSFKDENGTARAGLLTRADFAVPSNRRVAFVFWGQAGVMPLKDLPTGQVLMLGVGVRFQ